MFEATKKWVKRVLGKKGLARRFFRRERFWLSFVGLVILLLSVVVLWLLWALFTYTAYKGPETSGPAGDKFGGITALFSGLAFAGLIFTLFVQKKELQYQREELSHLVKETKETKEHLEAQANHLKSQSDFVGKQTFENSFFQLLTSFNSNLKSISVLKAQHLPEAVGADALETILNNGRRFFRDDGVGFDNQYAEFFQNRKNDLGPYFSQMYNILKFIKNSEVEDKTFYSNILRAQLSSAELSLLALNCFSIHGESKMAPLVKEFQILKNFDDETLFDNCRELSGFYRGWSLKVQHR